jgi:hypothetical protein
MEKVVNLAELRAATVALLDNLIELHGKETIAIDPDSDFYWEVPLDVLCKVKSDPPQLDIGRVSDDWEFVRPIATDASAATPLVLLHLAPVLRYLSARAKP